MTGTSEHANHRDRRSRALQSAMSLWREARFGCNDWRVSDRDWDLESQYFFCHTHTTTNQSPIHTKIARWLTRLLSTFNTLLSLSLSSYLYFSFLCWFSYFSSAVLFGCLLFMKMDLSRRLFNAVDSSQKFWINVGFEPRTSDVGSNSSVNWAQLPYSLSHFSVSLATFSIIIFTSFSPFVSFLSLLTFTHSSPLLPDNHSKILDPLAINTTFNHTQNEIHTYSILSLSLHGALE